MGTDGFTYRASDPGGSASTASVTLQVTPPPPLALTFTPVADAYVSSFRSGNNYGTGSSILVRNSNQHDYQGYLRFSVSGMTGTLTSATLRLYVTDGGSDAGGCYAVSNNYAGTSTPWTETGITWNNAPVIGGSPLASLGSASAGVWKEVDVTASIAGNGTYCYGLLTSSSDEVDFNSREASSNPPQLVLLQQSPSGNTPPVAGADSYSANEDNLLSVAAPGVLGNDTDADGDPLVVAANGAPAHGTLSMAANGSFTYTPPADYHGADSFTYTASDGRGGTATGTVSLNVISVNDPPVARADSWTATAGQTLAVAAPGVLANDTDVDGDALSAVLVSGVAHGSLTLNPNGSFSYTPAAGFSGGDAFGYRASDGSAQSASATVTLTVSGSGTAAPVVFQEIQSGGSTGTATVTTSAALAAVTGHLYVAAIAAKSSPTVTGVSGLGLAWTRVRAQCGGRAQTGVEVWIGRGTPTAGTVTATLQSAATNAVIQVTRYSGVDPTNPVGNVLSGNTLGLNGACSGGVDGASYAFDLSTSPGSLALAAVVSRSKTLTPGAGYALRGQIFQGADAGSMASVATIDKTAAAATTVVDGTFNSTTDWAVVAVEIRPQPTAEQAALASRQDAPDTAALRPPGAVTVRIHPNPFTQGTSIDCELPTEAHADASVYSVRGQRVRTLASGRRAAGSWPLHWDGRSDRGDGLGAGIYFLHLRIAGVDHEYKLVLLK